jgi:hypothetical protein
MAKSNRTRITRKRPDKQPIYPQALGFKFLTWEVIWRASAVICVREKVLIQVKGSN